MHRSGNEVKGAYLPVEIFARFLGENTTACPLTKWHGIPCLSGQELPNRIIRRVLPENHIIRLVLSENHIIRRVLPENRIIRWVLYEKPYKTGLIKGFLNKRGLIKRFQNKMPLIKRFLNKCGLIMRLGVWRIWPGANNAYRKFWHTKMHMMCESRLKE